MGRGHKSRKVVEETGRQMKLDGEAAPGDVPPVPGPVHEMKQLPYEERLLKWFLQREEALKKKR